jgi:hypothetical protein
VTGLKEAYSKWFPATSAGMQLAINSAKKLWVNSVQAISALTIATGQSVYFFPGGEWQITSATGIPITMSGGELVDSYITVSAGILPSAGALYINGASSAKVIRPYLYATDHDFSDAQRGIYIYGSSGVEVYRPKISNFDFPIRIAAASSDITITDADITQYKCGIYISGSNNIVLDRPYMLTNGHTTSAGFDGILTEDVSNLKILYAMIDDAAEHGIYLSGDTTGSDDIYILNPIIRNAYATGIKTLGTGVTNDRVKIINPIVLNTTSTGNTYGYQLRRLRDSQIINAILDTDGTAAATRSAAYGMYISDIDGLEIVNPIIRETANHGIYMYGIDGALKNITITNPVITTVEAGAADDSAIRIVPNGGVGLSYAHSNISIIGGKSSGYSYGVGIVNPAETDTVATVLIDRHDARGDTDAPYSIGTSHTAAVMVIGVTGKYQPTPTAKTTADTLTIAELRTGIITGTHTAGATQEYTLPTGTLVDAGISMNINESFDWTLINLSAAAIDTITLTAGETHTIVGNPIVQSANSATGGIYGNSATFRTRRTKANTYVTYRIN